MENESQILVKEINVGFLELSTTRETFHVGCWAKWRHEKRMTMLKWLLGAGVLLVILFLIVVIVPFLI